MHSAANITNNSYFFGNACMLVHVKAVEIFEFLDELCIAGYLLDDKKH